MKVGVLLAVLVFLVAFTQAAQAHGKSIFLVLETEDIQPTEDSLWELTSNNKPFFPPDLAISQFSGCAVVSFVVNKKGRTKKVKILNLMPKRQQARTILKMMGRVKWQAIEEGASPGEERREMRLDFCLSEESNQDAKDLCARAVKAPCE